MRVDQTQVLNRPEVAETATMVTPASSTIKKTAHWSAPEEREAKKDESTEMHRLNSLASMQENAEAEGQQRMEQWQASSWETQCKSGRPLSHS